MFVRFPLPVDHSRLWQARARHGNDTRLRNVPSVCTLQTARRPHHSASGGPRSSARVVFGAMSLAELHRSSLITGNFNGERYRCESNSAPGGSSAFDGDASNGLNEEAGIVSSGHRLALVEGAFTDTLKQGGVGLGVHLGVNYGTKLAMNQDPGVKKNTLTRVGDPARVNR